MLTYFQLKQIIRVEHWRVSFYIRKLPLAYVTAVNHGLLRAIANFTRQKFVYSTECKMSHHYFWSRRERHAF